MVVKKLKFCKYKNLIIYPIFAARKSSITKRDRTISQVICNLTQKDELVGRIDGCIYSITLKCNGLIFLCLTFDEPK